MDEIFTWMEQVVKANPGLVSSQVYGQTYEGNNITLLKIGLESGSRKKAIWMDCGIHAREWIAPAFCQWFVKEILRTYKTDERLNLVLRNVDIYVTPVLNVDGYRYSWVNESTRLWRKTRSASREADCACYGTDLNRNFYANWGMVGISRNCCSEIYCGPAPLSEREAVAVTEFVQQRAEDILCFLTIHSYGQLILVPYGHPQISAPNYDELMRVGLAAAEAMKGVHGMVYTVGTSPDVLWSSAPPVRYVMATGEVYLQRGNPGEGTEDFHFDIGKEPAAMEPCSLFTALCSPGLPLHHGCLMQKRKRGVFVD